ncbi:MAG TPA: LLM class F420-dependent oxidoreductase [Ktedonobacterales bacterium]|jgi:probable F420-dependent oxidoreductase|nr:LLM class F420-dependent oxidoreductase [Ktedonobacterales bacterium]
MASRPQLGRIGIWSSAFWTEREDAQGAARELERLGYGALWFPNRDEAFDRARELLDATRQIVVATGIVNIWTHPAEQAAAAHHALTQAHPGRFLLGLGVSHAHLVDHGQAGRYRKPVERMLSYLDALDTATPAPVPADERILAALGPRMLDIARTRSAGAHPYLTTVEHTRQARAALGAGPLLAPEQGVVLATDPTEARRIARLHLARYLQAPNYANNWRRLGFTEEDIADGGSDRLVDALIAWGDVDAIRARVAAHVEAGADHVCLQALTEDPAAIPYEVWRALAPLATATNL